MLTQSKRLSIYRKLRNNHQQHHVNVVCCANNSYVPQCIITLLSFCKFHPTIDAYIMGTKFTRAMKQLMMQHNIQYIEINLRNIFHSQWKYPIECYYHFYAPKVFLNRGYQYTIVLDGDIVCLRKITTPISHLASEYIGGIKGNIHLCQWRCLKKDLPKYKNILIKTKLRRYRTNTGVLFYNNVNLVNFKYSNRIKLLFDYACRVNAPRKGDDSLLGLLMLTTKTRLLKYIPKTYNTIDHSIPNMILYHMSTHKPWKTTKNTSNYVSLWRSYATKILLKHISNK